MFPDESDSPPSEEAPESAPPVVDTPQEPELPSPGPENLVTLDRDGSEGTIFRSFGSEGASEESSVADDSRET